MENNLKNMYIYITKSLLHLKLTQHCKSTILQLKKKRLKSKILELRNYGMEEFSHECNIIKCKEMVIVWIVITFGGWEGVGSGMERQLSGWKSSIY